MRNRHGYDLYRPYSYAGCPQHFHCFGFTRYHPKDLQPGEFSIPRRTAYVHRPAKINAYGRIAAIIVDSIISSFNFSSPHGKEGEQPKRG